MKWPSGTTHVREAKLSPGESTTHLNTLRCSLQAEATQEEVVVRNQHSQYLKICSSSSQSTGIACATFQPEIQKNYISPRIVRRLKLKTYTDCTASMSALVGGECAITTTRDYVFLVASTRPDTEQRRYRFYVIKHCSVRFDMLFGSESMPLP
jgi:hypothetical protein